MRIINVNHGECAITTCTADRGSDDRLLVSDPSDQATLGEAPTKRGRGPLALSSRLDKQADVEPRSRHSQRQESRTRCSLVYIESTISNESYRHPYDCQLENTPHTDQ
jgi:hypothetical protein